LAPEKIFTLRQPQRLHLEAEAENTNKKLRAALGRTVWAKRDANAEKKQQKA